MIHRLDIRPLSVNQAYTGQRFKTDDYRNWCKTIQWILPKVFVLPEPPFEIYFKFGFSSTLNDWDNCCKSIQDVIAKRYKFNDKLIRRGVVETEIVDKGKEYILFELKHYDK